MLNPSRLRVLRSLKDDGRDLLPVKDLQFNDPERQLGAFWKKERGPPISTPGPPPIQFSRDPSYYAPTSGQTPETESITHGVNRGEVAPDVGNAIIRGEHDAAAREATGTIQNLLLLNAQARKNEVGATGIWGNFIEAISPKMVEDFTVPDAVQSYRQTIDAFASALAGSPTGTRMGTNEVSRELGSDRFSVGMNDSPEEIALTRKVREGAIDSLLGLAWQGWKPKPVEDAMKMMDAGRNPEEVIAFLDETGIYGQYFDIFWPKDERYRLPRPPTSFGDPFDGMEVLGKDPNGRTIRMLDMGPVQ